jgi:hypothetical protein
MEKGICSSIEGLKRRSQKVSAVVDRRYSER